MFQSTSSGNIRTTSTSSSRKVFADEIEALHRRCGVYTKQDVVRRILDAVGWRSNVDLSKSTLLEPAAGDGAFVADAARRLVASYTKHGIPINARTLRERIKAFELHPREAHRARSRVNKILQEMGVHRRTAAACAQAWIKNGDFLLAKLPASVFTHAVGNPPYVRWSKIPPNLKAKYDRRISPDLIGGDLFLPFLDRALESLRPGGFCGFVCSDRWKFMAFAESFRKRWLPALEIKSETSLGAADAFTKDVDSYPSILIASRRCTSAPASSTPTTSRGKTLQELGYLIRVGPALGHTAAFVLEPDEHDVEPELLRPWIDGSEISEGTISWRGRHVIVMHNDDGELIDLNRFPRLKARLNRFRKSLEQRSIVRRDAPWFRPIDRVRAVDWMRPKLLIPELAKIPRLALDRSGAIPSHGVYAVFAPHDDIDELYGKLCDGRLSDALSEIAPRVKGGYIRCYRRFLSMVRIPP